MDWSEPAEVTLWNALLSVAELPSPLTFARAAKNNPRETGLAGDYPVIGWKMRHNGKEYGSYVLVTDRRPDAGLVRDVLALIADKAEQTQRVIDGQPAQGD